MKCPYCKSYQVKIIESKSEGETRRRRYHCFDCGRRFNTREYYADAVKKGKS